MNCPNGCTHYTGLKMKKIKWSDELYEFECVFCGYYDFMYLGEKKDPEESWFKE